MKTYHSSFSRALLALKEHRVASMAVVAFLFRMWELSHTAVSKSCCTAKSKNDKTATSCLPKTYIILLLLELSGALVASARETALSEL